MASNSENPVYVQIADELRQNINDGIYKAGDKLPTEQQLSLRFGAIVILCAEPSVC